MELKELEKLIESHDRQIEREVKRIEKSEEAIKEEESQILASERKIAHTLQRKPLKAFFIQPGTTVKEFGFFRSAFLRHFSRRRRLLYALIVTFATVLIWRGMWEMVDELPIISIAVVSLGCGIVLIWFLERYTDLH